MVGSKEIGLEINAEKTKCMIMSRDKRAGQNHNIKMGNTLCETVWQFKYLQTSVAYPNYIHEEIKSWNVC